MAGIRSRQSAPQAPVTKPASPGAADATPRTLPDKPRHPYGPRPLAALLPALTRPAFARQPPATAQVILDWPIIAGATLAALAQPRKLAGGTLTIACNGPAALELQHMTDLLIARINQHLGAETVLRLRLVHDAIGPVAPPAAAKPPRPDDHLHIAQSLGDFAPGPLRDALTTLGLALRSR